MRVVPVLTFLLLLTVSSGVSVAQEKYEREYGIPQREVPEKALGFIRDNYAGRRVRWYREESLQGYSIEAKLKWKGFWHSVEFDTSGRLQDVEVEIKYRDIDHDVRKEMEEEIETLFSSYKIDKVQRQWSGREDSIAQLIEKGTSEMDYTQRYEMVVRGRKDGTAHFYELLFDDEGGLLKQAKIVERSVNHMIF